MFIETNPVPVKTAAAIMGLCGEELRLPLAPLSDASRATLCAVMKSYGLI
jgi:4-hydroxy-tetrahydrodipicolinate synthase